MAHIDEFALIRLLTEREPTASSESAGRVVVGIGDDAAVAGIAPGFQLVVSCDAMVEHIHFNRYTMRDADIGYKAMAANLSDMAAMGAVPRYALISLSVPPEWTPERLRAIYDGLYECADAYGVAVVGGNTTSTPACLNMTVTIIGEVETGKALLRSSAQTGDAVFVTGFPGRSAAGLHLMSALKRPAGSLVHLPSPYSELVGAHRRPRPRVEAGRLLIKSGACRALNDISDGLASEAWEIAEASDKGIVLHEERLPIHADLLRYARETGKHYLDWLLYGGEDYELIGTVAAGEAEAVKAEFERQGLPFHIIGEVAGGTAEVRLKRMNGELQPLEKKGYNHLPGGESSG